ncbi:MAG: hypothetical protein ABSB36_01475 [Candidatus Dormibacteria bacterium]
MIRRMGAGGIAGLVLVLASCGSATPASTPSPTAVATSTPLHTTTPSPSATPTPLTACATAPAGGTPAAWGFAVTQGSEIDVLSTNGSVLNQTPNGGYGSTAPVEVGVGQAGVYLYDESTGELSVLGKTGASQDLGTLTPTGGWSNTDTVSLAESPSGTCWIFSAVSYDASANSTTELWIGGPGISPPSLVTTLHRSNTTSTGEAAGGYQALRWDPSGVLLGSYPTEVGGAGPFIDEDYSFSVVVSMDAATGAVSAPLCSSGQFADEAPDGTLACLIGLNTDAKIVVTKPSGATTTVDTGLASAGQVAFVGGTSAELTYCTSATTSSGGWSENLLSVQLGGQNPSPTTLASDAPYGQLEGPYAWTKLVSTTSIAELLGGTGPTSLGEVNLSTGQTTTVAPADSILGVL